MKISGVPKVTNADDKFRTKSVLPFKVRLRSIATRPEGRARSHVGGHEAPVPLSTGTLCNKPTARNLELSELSSKRLRPVKEYTPFGSIKAALEERRLYFSFLLLSISRHSSSSLASKLGELINFRKENPALITRLLMQTLHLL
uniref:Uncharacterized protein n=1 Tax=Romanomermis culicivorax TaxID=13658 RepID=A0A915HHQ8_ROMCU